MAKFLLTSPFPPSGEPVNFPDGVALPRKRDRGLRLILAAQIRSRVTVNIWWYRPLRHDRRGHHAAVKEVGVKVPVARCTNVEEGEAAAARRKRMAIIPADKINDGAPRRR